MLRVGGFTTVADLKIQTHLTLAATVTDSGNILASLDPVAGLTIQDLVVAIKGHIALTVADDHQQAKAAQPVGKNYSAIVDGINRLALIGGDKNAVPLEIGIGSLAAIAI